MLLHYMLGAKQLKLRILEIKPKMRHICPDLGVSSFQGMAEVAVKCRSKVLVR